MRSSLAIFLFCLAATAAPPFPSFVAPKAKVATNAGVWLAWVPGRGDTFLSNVTARTWLNARSFSNATVTGLLPGSSNVFVAFNADGFSNMATGLAVTAYGPTLSIAPVPINVVSWSVTTNWAGKTNVLMEQIDSFTGSFVPVFRIVPTNGQVVSVWRTNVGGSGFYRLMRE